MSLCNHTFPIYHLVVVVLLNDVQSSPSIRTFIFSVQGIPHLFIGFVAEVHILQSICKYSNHHTTKNCVGFRTSFLFLGVSSPSGLPSDTQNTFMTVCHNVTLIYHLLKFTIVKGAGFKASTNPAIKLKCLQ
jgi:hypothetical protein